VVEINPNVNISNEAEPAGIKDSLSERQPLTLTESPQDIDRKITLWQLIDEWDDFRA